MHMRRIALCALMAALIVVCLGTSASALEDAAGTTDAEPQAVSTEVDTPTPETAPADLTEGQGATEIEEPNGTSGGSDVGVEEELVPVAEAPVEVELTTQGEASSDTVVEDAKAGATQLSTTAVSQSPSICYTAHVQRNGWMPEVSNGAMGGTMGKSLRVEDIRIRLDGKDPSVDGGVEYQMHVQKKGWLSWARDGASGGTVGKSLRVEAFRLRLYGAIAEQYDVWYRVHVQSIGWMAWTSNGEAVGSEGSSLRIEAFQMLLAPKGQKPSNLGTSDVTFPYAKNYVKGGIGVTAHVQRRGWLKVAGNGQTAGTTGQGLRIEAIKLSLSNYPQGITYRAHVQKEGWQSWRSDGEVAGTTGKGRRVESMQIKLYGEAASQYNIYYRAHVQGIGWMAWAKNGETSGSLGLGLRIEAMQVRLVKKGSSVNLPSGAYKGKAVDATTKKPSNMSIKIVPQMAHGYKSPYYQRCIVMHDTTEYRGFDYWITNWIERGGVGTQFMVNEQGEIRQYMDMNQICWHVGGASYSYLDQKYNVVAHKPGAGSAMNQCSIGIEIDHVEDGRPYPAAQLDAIDRLIAYIDKYYGFHATILQHKDYKLDNSDCSDEFQGYLRHMQKYRTTR